MTTTQTAGAVLLPVGQFFGTLYPVAGSTERYHRVRLGDEVWELDDERFTLWALAHGTGDRPAEQLWTVPAACEAAASQLPGVDGASLLHGLLAEGLAVEVAPGEAVEFARRHRVGTRMLGLGNSAEQPWLWSIGFFARPVVSVTRGRLARPGRRRSSGAYGVVDHLGGPGHRRLRLGGRRRGGVPGVVTTLATGSCWRGRCPPQRCSTVAPGRRTSRR
ncbi:hypothetical protein [Micromonospora sp. NPDC048898]|uniref:hypothetical protein n=1 Tax=Micromonospora sp. NPDC048898 TaxID=3364260 RepID=UPI0037161AED